MKLEECSFLLFTRKATRGERERSEDDGVEARWLWRAWQCKSTMAEVFSVSSVPSLCPGRSGFARSLTSDAALRQVPAGILLMCLLLLWRSFFCFFSVFRPAENFRASSCLQLQAIFLLLLLLLAHSLLLLLRRIFGFCCCCGQFSYVVVVAHFVFLIFFPVQNVSQ